MFSNSPEIFSRARTICSLRSKRWCSGRCWRFARGPLLLRPARSVRRCKPRAKKGVCTSKPAVLIVNQMVKYSSRTLNRTFAALADPTRRHILAHLARGDRRVTDLARPHAMSLPAVSKHLRVLEKAGLLRRRRYGRVHEMQLDAKPLKEAAQWVEEYRKFWEGSLDRLAVYLEKTNPAQTRKGKV